MKDDAKPEARKLALVTGASRKEGIGYEVARQLAKKGFHVVLSARGTSAAAGRAEDLMKEGLDVVGQVLDVADDASVRALAWKLGAKFGRLDVLVNNAAGNTDSGEEPSKADLASAHEVMEATLFGTWRVTQAFLPLLRKAEHARIVNVSSGAGSHGDADFGLHTTHGMGAAYGASKAALNALTVMFARELASEGILVNAVCPGFTATFPGAATMGARPVSEGAAGVVWVALLPDGGPTGAFFRDEKALSW